MIHATEVSELLFLGLLAHVLGDYLWSKQRQIARSLHTNKRTVSPACVGPGKTFLAGRLAAWFVATSNTS